METNGLDRTHAVKEAEVERGTLGRKLGIGILSGGMWLMTVGSGWTGEPVTGISYLLVNPSSVHRKVFKLEGVAKNVIVHSGSEIGTNQSLCGAEFELEDSSGTIAVLYRARCQVGAVRATVVTERMPCVVEGYMEAPPTMLRRSDGTNLGFRIIAQTVTPVP
jgi:hypothetical protein